MYSRMPPISTTATKGKIMLAGKMKNRLYTSNGAAMKPHFLDLVFGMDDLHVMREF